MGKSDDMTPEERERVIEVAMRFRAFLREPDDAIAREAAAKLVDDIAKMT